MKQEHDKRGRERASGGAPSIGFTDSISPGQTYEGGGIRRMRPGTLMICYAPEAKQQ